MKISRGLDIHFDGNEEVELFSFEPRASGVYFSVIKVGNFCGSEGLAEPCHSLFPFLFAYHGESLDFTKVFHVKLDIFPESTRVPARKVMH